MASERRGPFDRLLGASTEPAAEERRPPDRAGLYVGGTIIGLALLLLILLLPPISVLSRGDDDASASTAHDTPGVADTYRADARTRMPKLPAGLVAASLYFAISAPENQRGASAITVGLNEKQTDSRDLGLYTYVEGKWQRLSDTSLVAGGEAARGEVAALPGNVAVLRRTVATLQVAGSLPANTALDERAAGVLTTLHPIVFTPAADGTLAGQPPAVPPATYKVVPGVVPLDPAVVDDILRSTELQSAHASAVAEAVRQGNYEGINLDYRNVAPALREQFTAFVQLVAQALHTDSRTLTLTLPMPSSAEGSLDTGAYDWEELGRLADAIEVGGELDQELYFQHAETALEYIVEKVDRTKVLLTMSSLSVERGGDGLRAMSLNDALAIAGTVEVKAEGEIAASSPVQLVARNLSAAEGASGMLWDDTARSVTFSYPGRGGKRTVWMANAFSAAFRVELAQRFGLGGVSIDDVSVEGGGADVWAPIQQVAETGSLTLVKPNGELLVPAWNTQDGTIAPQNGDTVTWTSPGAAGTYTVSLIVSDGVVRAGQLVSLDVAAAAAPAPTPAPP